MQTKGRTRPTIDVAVSNVAPELCCASLCLSIPCQCFRQNLESRTLTYFVVFLSHICNDNWRFSNGCVEEERPIAGKNYIALRYLWNEEV